MTKSKFAFLLGLFIPALFAFKSLILPGPVVWGDAPYFYPEALREFVADPLAWMSFGNNFGGPNSFLFIYPLMFLYGSLYSLFGFSNDIIIRLLFYFPAIILAFASPVFFARYLGYSRMVQFFASLVYGLNTYFLLVVDGGQIGVALAYGLFPLVVLALHQLLTKPNFLQFFKSLAILLLLTIADLRLSSIAVITTLIWAAIERVIDRRAGAVKGLKLIVLLGIALAGLSAYWLIPLLTASATQSLDVSRLQLVSLLNGFFLFQPHWPQNEFGKVFPPPFYFGAIPLLVFGSLLWSYKKRVWGLASLALIFAFLAKGESGPFGTWYGWVTTNVPFGIAFRDSTKFFAPLILFAGVLIGITVEHLTRLRCLTPLHKGVTFSIYLYLLFLVHPAILGNLNGVLAGRAFPQDFGTIHQKLAQEEGLFRTLWFPERHPFNFHTEGKPALDGKDLVNERLFASMNAGTFDRFNFLHKNQSIEWLELLGVRYLMFSGDFRKSSLKDEERVEWKNLVDLVASLPNIEKIDWGQEFPVYKLPKSKPRIFSTNKLIVVVGSDDVYEKLKQDSEENKFSLANQAFVFLEDGKFDSSSLSGIASDSAILVFNKTNEKDFTMSFFSDYFLGPKDSSRSEWAVRESKEYLKWKYEFLIKGVDVKEFDYSKGIAFSSQGNEEIDYNLYVPKDNEYILALRSLNGKGEQLLKMSFSGKEELLPYKSEGEFEWFVKGPFQLKKGRYKLSIRNPGGFKAINVVALIPKNRWTEVDKFAKTILGKFEKIEIDGREGMRRLQDLLAQSKWHTVGYKMISPVRYEVNLPQDGYWLVFSDNYHKEWKLKKGKEFFGSYPFYSTINGFYYKSEWQGAEISFEGQKRVRWGLYFSAVSILSLAILFLWLYPKKK